jgi:SAM-dependent methyltransferase
LFEKQGHRFVRCKGCELERIDPQPTDETLSAIYGRHYYDSWGLQRDEETVRGLKRMTFAGVLDRLPPLPHGAKLLDCGAATGFLLEEARDRGYDAYGLELSEFGASEMTRKFGEGRAFRGEIEAACFPGTEEGEFLAVTMCDYLEHVRLPQRVLQRARDFLAPGGVLAVTTPDTGSLSHRLLGKGWSHYKAEHLFYFRRDNLQRLLHRCGFSRVEFRPLLKALNIKYIREQFEVYPHPLLGRVARAVERLAPERLSARSLKCMTGEMLAMATRS